MKPVFTSALQLQRWTSSEYKNTNHRGVPLSPNSSDLGLSAHRGASKRLNLHVRHVALPNPTTKCIAAQGLHPYSRGVLPAFIPMAQLRHSGTLSEAAMVEPSGVSCPAIPHQWPPLSATPQPPRTKGRKGLGSQSTPKRHFWGQGAATCQVSGSSAGLEPGLSLAWLLMVTGQKDSIGTGTRPAPSEGKGRI